MKSETENPNTERALFNDKKPLILIGLLVLIALVLYVQWSPSASHSSSTSASSSRATRKLSAETSDPPFLFSRLNDPPQSFDSEKRNLFDFHEPPPPPAPSAAETQMAEEEQQPAAVCGDQICQPGETYENCPTDCQPPPPPDIPLRYIGYLAENGGAVVFLTDGKEVYMGRENDVIANKYRILKITDQSVELGYLNANQSRSIPFQGNNQS
jgi:hypothetical protein